MRYYVNTLYLIPYTFMLSMTLKTLNIILMCFDGKKQPPEKNTRESSAIVVKRKCRQNQKLISF